MPTIPELKQQYESLDRQVSARGEEAVDLQCLLAFQYEYPEQESQVDIDTDEFTALCPWTGLPLLWHPPHSLRSGPELH
jgi:NADPH-dependent 7-cyano-7-deazaguanine reductase QueF